MDRVRFEAINPTFLLAVTKTPDLSGPPPPPSPPPLRLKLRRFRTFVVRSYSGQVYCTEKGLHQRSLQSRPHEEWAAWPRPSTRSWILSLSAHHPDDVEIACGGTLARLVRKGYSVGIVDLTDGEPTPLSAGPDVRLAEGGAGRQDSRRPGPHQSEPAQPSALRLLRGAGGPGQGVPEVQGPRSCSGFGGKTVLASPDHYQAMLITDAAVFYSRLTKWDEHFDRPARTHDQQPVEFPDRDSRAETYPKPRATSSPTSAAPWTSRSRRSGPTPPSSPPPRPGSSGPSRR